MTGKRMGWVAAAMPIGGVAILLAGAPICYALFFKPEIAEKQVNTFALGTEWNPSAAVDATGNFVIVWMGDGQGSDDDDYGNDVFAQRYDASGMAQGEEFQVNSFSGNEQGWPLVGMDAPGNYVVAWLGGTQRDGFDIYAKRYNATGAALGEEFQVTYTKEVKSHSLGMDASGNFVIAWNASSGEDDDFSSSIYARRYDAAGTPQGSEFRVNTTQTDSYEQASVGMGASGNLS